MTPLTRPQNLPIMKVAIEHQLKDWHWWIVADLRHAKKPAYDDPRITQLEMRPDSNGFAAGKVRNEAFRHIKEGWIVCLDDDTIPHPNLSMLLDAHQDVLVRWNVIHFDGCIANSPKHNAGGEGADSAGFAYRAEAFPDFFWDPFDLNCDCDAYRRLKQLSNGKHAYYDVAGGYYNFLRPQNHGE